MLSVDVAFSGAFESEYGASTFAPANRHGFLMCELTPSHSMLGLAAHPRLNRSQTPWLPLVIPVYDCQYFPDENTGWG